MEADEERDLVRRCQDGSEAAFAELVKTFEPLVWGAIWRTTADRARGEDLALEVFLRIYRGIRRFRGDSRLSTWIFRIVINVCAETRGMSEKTLEAQFDDLPADRKESFAMRDRAFADLE